jgi:hypothetical protein
VQQNGDGLQRKMTQVRGPYDTPHSPGAEAAMIVQPAGGTGEGPEVQGGTIEASVEKQRLNLRSMTPRQSIIQPYRPVGGSPISTKEEECLDVARVKLSNHTLGRLRYFHVTSLKNLGGTYSLGVLSARGGQGGAGAALGGVAGANFQKADVGWAFATDDVDTAIEYYELHLARAVMENDAMLQPIVLEVKPTTRWDLESDPRRVGVAGGDQPRPFAARPRLVASNPTDLNHTAKIC